MEEEESKDKVEVNSVAGMSASDTFCRTMRDMICERDVELIKDMQLDALSKFEKTNEKFEKFNHLSGDRYHRLHHLYQNHTKMLLDMKKDLDVVFRRIRNLKSKLAKQYGESFIVTSKTINQLEEELEVEAAYKEEKPQDSTTQSVDNSIEEKTTDAQSTNDHASVGETIEKAQMVYSTTLRPQLSSSDDSYGSDSTNSDSSNETEIQPKHSATMGQQLSSSDESLESESDHEKSQEISTTDNDHVGSQNSESDHEKSQEISATGNDHVESQNSESDHEKSQ